METFFKGFKEAGCIVNDDAADIRQSIINEITSEALKLKTRLQELKKHPPKRTPRSRQQLLMEATNILEQMFNEDLRQEYIDKYTNADTKKCTNCKRLWPPKFFIPKHYKLPLKCSSKLCLVCRESKKRSYSSKHTIKGQWKHFWNQIVKPILLRPCPFCKNTSPQPLECDHISNQTKVNALSDHMFWSNKPVEEFIHEVNKMRAFLCRTCHFNVSSVNKEHGGKRKADSLDATVMKNRVRMRRNRSKNKQKRIELKTGCLPPHELEEFQVVMTGKIGECHHCQKKCTNKNVLTFDFNHLCQHKKQKKFSTILSRSGTWDNCKKHFMTEARHCGVEMLCRACHTKHTYNKL